MSYWFFDNLLSNTDYTSCYIDFLIILQITLIILCVILIFWYFCKQHWLYFVLYWFFNNFASNTDYTLCYIDFLIIFQATLTMFCVVLNFEWFWCKHKLHIMFHMKNPEFHHYYNNTNHNICYKLKVAMVLCVLKN